MNEARTSPEKPLILVDGSSWLFRAYHALPPLTNAEGMPTGAVFGMGNMLRKLLKDYTPERICVVFDPSGDTFRNALYAEYKANRSETPEDLSVQYPSILELIEAMGLPQITVPGVEADDVIGTLARAAAAQGEPVLIVTSDKDMAQLVDERVSLLDTMKNRRMDPGGVVEKFGVSPERIIDYLALMGDTSDNIPGVPMVGPKTAAKWLNEYGTLDDLIARADEVKGKAGENLRAHLTQLPLARELATIKLDVELPVTLDSLQPREPDRERLRALYRKLGFNRLADELDGPTAKAEPSEGAETPPPHVNAAETEVTTVLDQASFDAMLAALNAAELVCFDTETDSLDANQAQLVGLAFAVEAGRGWYVPVAHDYLGAPDQLDRTAVLEALRPLLEDPNKPKLGQHLKYDLNVLAAHGVQVRGVAHDTMLQSYVLDAAGNRHDMDTLALKYLGHQTIKFADVAGKGKGQITFNQVSIDKAAPYSAEDADITLRLHQTLYPQLAAEPALKKVYETIEIPLVPVLARIEQTGVKVDVALLRTISSELAERMAQLQTEAHREAGGEFNLGSPKQLGVILYEQLGLPVLGKTPKGEPSTAEDVLEELAAQHPLPRLILDWRAMQKLRSTYAEQLPLAVNPRTGRIHTSYHQAVAATGRLSSSDPNLQNIPVRTAEGRRIRQAFIAEPGNALLAIDYSQIELRLMAHFSGDPRLQHAFAQGQDIHQATAAEVFGLPLDEVPTERRRAAKAINFGLIYGMSAFGLARQLGIPRGEAQEYIDRFFGRYPGVKHFMDTTRTQARERGYVETLFGRRLYLPNIASRNQGLRQYAERTAINAPLQGTAADLIKLAMLDVSAFLAERAPAIRMIMQVHDELVFEGPEAEIRARAAEIAGRMCRISALDVPLVADWGVALQWDAAHSAEGHASS
ncbi:DNA polymerase I [Sinimarinibacterium sp. CAU 1509]|uniref:DNA polymerase I n=1 Tax=Sinimarinibacterium sp. CAU 1509 TaxID=2562283 RepID=UPI0010AD43F5|nr:DNA polymerase I [Sinimarinibacterium sp. CAU 1509]TJY58782.1 DNA polymerase I [Sinimarinibacterium sp. CAU 1509]